MHKSMPNMNRKKDKNEDAAAQKKLLELHQKIIALEKLDIRRQESLISAAEMKKACRELFNNSKDCIAILQDRKIVCISPSLAKLLGYPQKEMLNTSFATYIHPQELFKLAGYYLKRISGGEAPPIYNTILKRRDGKDIRVELMAGIFPFFKRPADLVIVQEITE
jgi:PAS domain S-box-containing protein